MSGTLEETVEAALAAIRPALEQAGAEVALIAVERGIVRVRVRLADPADAGAISGLLIGIQRTLQASTRQIRAVVNQDLVDAGYPVEQLAAQMQRLADQGTRLPLSITSFDGEGAGG